MRSLKTVNKLYLSETEWEEVAMTGLLSDGLSEKQRAKLDSGDYKLILEGDGSEMLCYFEVPVSSIE